MATFMRKYRVFPILFSLFYLNILMDTWQWYTALIVPTNGQSGFAGAVFAAGAAWFKFYVETGNNYGGN